MKQLAVALIVGLAGLAGLAWSVPAGAQLVELTETASSEDSNSVTVPATPADPVTKVEETVTAVVPLPDEVTKLLPGDDETPPTPPTPDSNSTSDSPLLRSRSTAAPSAPATGQVEQPVAARPATRHRSGRLARPSAAPTDVVQVQPATESKALPADEGFGLGLGSGLSRGLGPLHALAVLMVAGVFAGQFLYVKRVPATH